jgi:hypothetical protein
MLASDYREFADALCHAERPPPPGLRSTRGVDLVDRFAIYRNTVHVSLVDALADRCPTVQALVGTEFFRAMARAYVQEHKPESPVLQEYGPTLPAFIAQFPPAATLPYLVDVARLDCAWSEVWAAPEAMVLQRSQLARWSPLALLRAVIVPHPAARLIQSAWPIASLWSAHQQPAADLSQLCWTPEAVLLTRPNANVQMLRLDATAAGVLAVLLEARTLTAAAEVASRHNNLDLGALLGTAIDAGMITEVLST